MDPLDRGCAVVDDSGPPLLAPAALPAPRLRVARGRDRVVAFTADGATLVAAAYEGDLRAWPLSAEAPRRPSGFFRKWNACHAQRFQDRRQSDPREIVVAATGGRVQVMPVDGGEPRELEGLPKRQLGCRRVLPRRSAGGRGSRDGPAKEKRIHVWDLETGAVQVLEPVPNADDKWKGGFLRLSFVGEDRIVATVTGNGLMLFDLRDGKGKVLSSVINRDLAIGRSGRVGVGLACDRRGFVRDLPVWPRRERSGPAAVSGGRGRLAGPRSERDRRREHGTRGLHPDRADLRRRAAPSLRPQGRGQRARVLARRQVARLGGRRPDRPPLARPRHEAGPAAQAKPRGVPRDAPHLHQRPRGARCQVSKRLEARARAFPRLADRPALVS